MSFRDYTIISAILPEQYGDHALSGGVNSNYNIGEDQDVCRGSSYALG